MFPFREELNSCNMACQNSKVLYCSTIAGPGGMTIQDEQKASTETTKTNTKQQMDLHLLETRNYIYEKKTIRNLCLLR